MRCIFQKEQFLDSYDKPQINFIVDSIAPSLKVERQVLMDVVSECANQPGVTDPCEFAFNMLRCYTSEKTITNLLKVEL